MVDEVDRGQTYEEFCVVGFLKIGNAVQPVFYLEHVQSNDLILVLT